jgi:hypothetical protein
MTATLLLTHRGLFQQQRLLASAPVNVLLTPHVAAGTLGGGRQSEFTNLVSVLQGQPLRCRVA